MAEGNGNGRRGVFSIPILGTLLTWLDRPWKGIVILALMPLVALGAVAWYEREVLEEALRQRMLEPNLIDADDADEWARGMVGTADLVVVYRVELADNVQRVVAARNGQGEVQSLRGLSVPFIPVSSAADIVISELTGAIVCWDLTTREDTAVSEHLVRYQAAGYTYVCARKVPSAAGMMAGLVHLAWDEKPSRGAEFSARARLHQKADELVSW